MFHPRSIKQIRVRAFGRIGKTQQHEQHKKLVEKGTAALMHIHRRAIWATWCLPDTHAERLSKTQNKPERNYAALEKTQQQQQRMRLVGLWHRRTHAYSTPGKLGNELNVTRYPGRTSNLNYRINGKRHLAALEQTQQHTAPPYWSICIYRKAIGAAWWLPVTQVERILWYMDFEWFKMV